jgi:hypothetical protein
MPITPTQFAEMEARVLPKLPPEKRTANAVDREGDLHDEIIEHCRARGYLYFHQRMDKPSHGLVGFPDFVIFMPAAMTVFLECKAKGGKTTTEQLAKLAHARKLGYHAEVVDNFSDAYQIIEHE